jgi:hypothetical protein
MLCSFCQSEAQARCPSCSRAFCSLHGTAYCLNCAGAVQSPRDQVRRGKPLQSPALCRPAYHEVGAELFEPYHEEPEDNFESLPQLFRPEFCYACQTLTQVRCTNCRAPYCTAHGGSVGGSGFTPGLPICNQCYEAARAAEGTGGSRLATVILTLIVLGALAVVAARFLSG